MPSHHFSAKQAAKQPGRQASQARLRRIQSMAGPLPRDARAFGAAQILARGWKAKAFRAAPDSHDSDSLKAREVWVEFGLSFLTYAVMARQNLVKVIDGLGLGRRDAARAMSLLYATDTYTDPENAGKWLEESVARLLFPASGLHAEDDDASGNPESKAIAEGLLKAAGQPGMHALFLREFKALADEIYWSEGEIAFIDSAAVDAENGQGLPSLFLPPRLRSRFLFAVRRDTGHPLGLAEIRNPGIPVSLTEEQLEDMWSRNLMGLPRGMWFNAPSHDDDEDDEDGEASCGRAGGAEPVPDPEEAEDAAKAPDGEAGYEAHGGGQEGEEQDVDEEDGQDDGQNDEKEDWEEDGEDGWPDAPEDNFDCGRLGEAFELFAEAGIAPQSCLLGGRLLADPSLDRFYDAQGRLALPYIAMVKKSDPLLQEAVEAADLEELLRSGSRMPHEGGLLFITTRPVQVGTDSRPAWLHVGWFYLPPDEESLAEQGAGQDGDGEARPAGTDLAPEELRDWWQSWRLGIVTGACMTGPEAFTEYYALQKAAELCDSSPVRERSPAGTTAVLRRGHNLFSAIGLVAWGLMAHSMENSWESDPEHLAERLEHLRACTLHPRRITIPDITQDDSLITAFMAAGIACPRTIFLEGRRLRYDPLRDFADKTMWGDDEDEDFVAFMKELTPDRLDAMLMDRPFWPRRHRPWRIGKGRRHPRARLRRGQDALPAQAPASRT